ncbi:hypothetical protein ABPG75_012303 [Micractinium tetrahymenae]
MHLVSECMRQAENVALVRVCPFTEAAEVAAAVWNAAVEDSLARALAFQAACSDHCTWSAALARREAQTLGALSAGGFLSRVLERLSKSDRTACSLDTARGPAGTSSTGSTFCLHPPPPPLPPAPSSAGHGSGRGVRTCCPPRGS